MHRRSWLRRVGALALGAGAGCVERAGWRAGGEVDASAGDEADTPAQAAGWPLPAYDAAGTARNPEASLPAEPERRWTTDVGGEVRTGPVAGADAVYVVTHRLPMHEAPTQYCHALDWTSGDARWTHPLGPFGSRTLGSDADAVYVLEDGSDLVALDAGDGEETWDAAASGVRNLAVADGTIYASLDEHLVALDAADGAERWRTPLEPTDAQPTVAGDTVHVACEDGTVRALVSADGTERWRHDLGGEVRSQPAVHDGVVHVETGALVAIEDGEERWRFDGARLVGRGVALDGERVYAGGRQLYAVDAATGELAWSADVATRQFVNRPPAVADGRVWVADSSGGLAAVAAADGTVEWRAEVPTNAVGRPAVVDGQLAVVGRGGAAVAFGAPEADPEE